MEVLPLELIGIVCDYLDPRDLLRLACCNRDLYFLAEPRLYAKLDILIGPYGVRASSAKLLNIFMLHPHLCRFINRIEVREASPHVCTGDQVMLLQVLVATVLKSVGPTTLRSFTWIIARDADCFFLHGLPDQLTSLTAHGDLLRTIGLFPNLKQLDCGRIGSLEELEWIFWHIQNCSSLRKLRLGFAPGRRLFRIEKSLNFFFSLLHSLQSLEELSLEVIEVRQLKLESFPLLKKLGLKRCVGTGEALLNSIGIAHVRLKALSLAVQDELHHPIAEFITYLASFSPLHELTVLFSGSSSIFPLKSVLLHGSALRLLILDCRVLAGEPTTVWRYSVDHLRLIARSCPLLIALGLPINLGIERVMGSRPRRAEALVSSTKTLANAIL